MSNTSAPFVPPRLLQETGLQLTKYMLDISYGYYFRNHYCSDCRTLRRDLT